MTLRVCQYYQVKVNGNISTQCIQYNTPICDITEISRDNNILVYYIHTEYYTICVVTAHCSMLRVFSALTLLFADDIDICAVRFGKEGNIGKISIGKEMVGKVL